MGSTLGSQESAKLGEKRPYRRFGLPKTRDLDPSSDFPNSFGREILGSPDAGSWIERTPGRVAIRLRSPKPGSAGTTCKSGA